MNKIDKILSNVWHNACCVHTDEEQTRLLSVENAKQDLYKAITEDKRWPEAVIRGYEQPIEYREGHLAGVENCESALAEILIKEKEVKDGKK